MLYRYDLKCDLLKLINVDSKILCKFNLTEFQVKWLCKKKLKCHET